MRPRGRRARILHVVGAVRRPDPTKARAVKAKLPHCGAKCRDGSRCRNPGVGAGGRCPKHGGLTPSGDRWHVVRLPRDDRRYARKLETLAKRRAKRAAEIAAFSPPQRERYDKWLKTHKAGSRASRERARQDREAAKLFAKPRPPAPPNPELERLEAELAAIRITTGRLEALLEAHTLTESEKSDD
jgi:hypothetical protein